MRSAPGNGRPLAAVALQQRGEFLEPVAVARQHCGGDGRVLVGFIPAPRVEGFAQVRGVELSVEAQLERLLSEELCGRETERRGFTGSGCERRGQREQACADE